MDRWLAGITIGQTPRLDMTEELKRWLPEKATLRTYGLLDPYSDAEIEERFVTTGDEDVLVTRVRSGKVIRLDGAALPQLLRAALEQAESDGAALSMLLCTGAFPAVAHERPLLLPSALEHNLLRSLERQVGVVVPDAAQCAPMGAWWRSDGVSVTVRSASPYGETEKIVEAARQLVQDGCEVICLDCMGFTHAQKTAVALGVQRPVILARSLLARMAAEML